MSTGMILAQAAIQLKVEGLDGVRADIERLKAIFVQGITSLNGLALASGAAFVAGLGGIGSLVRLFETAEDKTRMLGTALRAEGEEVKANTARLSAHAAALADVANLTENHVKDLEIQGLRLGISARQIAEYTTMSIGLARARGIGEKDAMDALARANLGNEAALVRLMLERRGHIHGAQAALVEAQKVASRGLAIKVSDIDTFAGQMTALSNAALKAGTAMGKVFAPAVAPLVNLLTAAVRDLTAWISHLSAAQAQAILKWTAMGAAFLGVVAILPGLIASVTALGTALMFLATNPIGILIVALGSLVAWFAYTHSSGATMGQRIAHVWDAAIAYWTFFKDFVRATWDNIGLVFKLGFLKVSDAVYSMVEVIFWLGRVMGQVGAWIGTNWKEILVDGFNAAYAVIKNFGTNAVAALREFWRWVHDPTSAFRPDFTPLRDEFHRTISQFPELVQLHLSHPLQEAIDELSGQLGTKFDPAFDKLRRGLAQADADAAAIKPGGARPDLPKVGVPSPEGAQKRGTASDILTVLANIQGGALGGGDPRLAEAKKTNQHLSRNERIQAAILEQHKRVADRILAREQKRHGVIAVAAP